MNQTSENDKKPSFGPNFSPFGPIFFFKNLSLPVTKYHGQLSSHAISEKINDPILSKLSDGRTDGQTDDSDFIGRCTTNVEHRKCLSQI